jgi:hypothetical protein
MLKVPSHCSFRPDLHELWSKEKARVKLGIWLPTTNPLKAGVKWGPIRACYTPLERSFLKAIKYLFRILKTNLIWKIYERPKFWDNKSLNFGTPTWESQGKVTFGCRLHKEAQSILWGGEWCLLPKVASCVKLMLEVVLIKFVAPLPLNLH